VATRGRLVEDIPATDGSCGMERTAAGMVSMQISRKERKTFIMISVTFGAYKKIVAFTN
jgi:hypothetical protein